MQDRSQRTDSLSHQSLGFSVQARRSTKLTVKEKGLINLCTCVLHMYQLLQTTSFEMCLLVIIPFHSALGEGVPFISAQLMSSLIDISHFGHKLGMGFAL